MNKFNVYVWILLIVMCSALVYYSYDTKIIDSDITINQRTSIYPIELYTTIYNIYENSTTINLRAGNIHSELVNVSYLMVIPSTDNLIHSSFNLIHDNGYYKYYVTDYELVQPKMNYGCCNSIIIQHENELDYNIDVILS